MMSYALAVLVGGALGECIRSDDAGRSASFGFFTFVLAFMAVIAAYNGV